MHERIDFIHCRMVEGLQRYLQDGGGITEISG